jgi:hypothetical protein
MISFRLSFRQLLFVLFLIDRWQQQFVVLGLSPFSRRQQDLTSSSSSSSSFSSSNRRHWLTKIATVSSLFISNQASSSKAFSEDSITIKNNDNNNYNELPSVLRDYTNLAPLGRKETYSNKSMNLSLDELAERLTNDLTRGSQGNGGYFISGDISTDIFKDDCVFEDPTNRVSSLSQYQRALTILFASNRSTVEIISPLVVNEGDYTITGRLRSDGYLQLPWNPYISSYETTITYTIDRQTGLIERQSQTWSKSASKALQETFTPGSRPQKSTIHPKSDEPTEVTRLFDIVKGRRPNEYSVEERIEIDSLIDQIIIQNQIAEEESGRRSLLTGTWILTYLQPGPDGAGIDRRIPFPDFDFNDNYQIFSFPDGDDGKSPNNDVTVGRVTNVGQLLGPLANVQVSGSLQEASSRRGHDGSLRTRRFEATIQGGKLCFSSLEPKNCWIDLPMIQGKGLFDSLYVGERLRIGQNINGGGARVVQIRIS